MNQTNNRILVLFVAGAIQIQSFEPGISAKEFGEGYEDRPAGKELPYPSVLPDRVARDKALKESGVLAISKYEKFDDVDRDLLYLKAKNRPLAELKKNFPDIPEATLKKLKKEIGK